MGGLRLVSRHRPIQVTDVGLWRAAHSCHRSFTLDWKVCNTKFFFSHINITSVFKLIFVSNPAHSIDKMDSCKVIMERDIQIQRNIVNAMDKSKILYFFMNFM